MRSYTGRLARAAALVGLGLSAAGCAQKTEMKCGICVSEFGDTIQYSDPDSRRMFIYYKDTQCFESHPIMTAIDTGVNTIYSDCGLDPYQRLDAKKIAMETPIGNGRGDMVVETQKFLDMLKRMSDCQEVS